MESSLTTYRVIVPSLIREFFLVYVGGKNITFCQVLLGKEKFMKENLPCVPCRRKHAEGLVSSVGMNLNGLICKKSIQ